MHARRVTISLMNDLLPPSENRPQPNSGPDQTQTTNPDPKLPPPKRFSLLTKSQIATAVLGILLVAQWWYFQSDIGNLREEMAGQFRNLGIMSTETKALAKSVSESTKELQG